MRLKVITDKSGTGSGAVEAARGLLLNGIMETRNHVNRQLNCAHFGAITGRISKKITGFCPPVTLALACALAAAGIPPSLRAQAPSATPPSPFANRYLLVAETSLPMQPRVRGAAQAVYDLLAPGFNELRPGDTLGVWTFNDTLYAGQFPLQDFSPQNQLHVAEQVASYLQSRRYEKEPNLDKALLAVQRIVKNSDFLTVIFVTTGNEEFHGTPYDKSINESFKKWRSPQQQAHMPLLTILRCEHGSFTGFVVNQAPWPVEMPPLPAELQRSAIAKRETPASIQATAAAALAAATKPQQPAPPPAATPEPTPQIPKPAPIPVQTAANTAAPSPVEQSAAPLAAAPVEIVKPALQAPVTQPIKVAPQTPAKSLPAPFRQIVTTTNTVRRVAASTPTNAPKQLAAASTPKTSPQARAAQRTNSAAATWPEPPAPSTTGPARPLFSIAIPWREWFSPRNLCIAGGSVVGIGLLTLAFKLRARARKPFHISLITHSVEKE